MPPAVLVRAGSPADDEWIVALGTEAYAALGDYHGALTGWLAQPGVTRLVAIDPERTRLGFVLTGFCGADDLPAGELICDLIAVAVEPEARGRGVGRRLVDATIDLAETARAAGVRVVDVRLTVADDNPVARHLFATAGFTMRDPAHGQYDNGQRALRLGRTVDGRP
jgi:ribosomal protein S18 acetylase RimI-like enzyme